MGKIFEYITKKDTLMANKSLEKMFKLLVIRKILIKPQGNTSAPRNDYK